MRRIATAVFGLLMAYQGARASDVEFLLQGPYLVGTPPYDYATIGIIDLTLDNSVAPDIIMSSMNSPFTFYPSAWQYTNAIEAISFESGGTHATMNSVDAGGSVSFSRALDLFGSGILDATSGSPTDSLQSIAWNISGNSVISYTGTLLGDLLTDAQPRLDSTQLQSFGSITLTFGDASQETFTGLFVTPIPEPSSAWLVLAGLPLLASLRRSR